MKVLVTGAKGQLGFDLVNYLHESYDILSYDKTDLDITDICNTVKIVKEVKPDIIINCAAYTDVDDCERNVDLSYKINAIGVGNLAAAAVETGARLLHISTDFVFDGESFSPYTEFSTPNPISVYGKSKLAGEEMVREICPRHYILRTAWLYGRNRNNFVKTMLNLAESTNKIRVVNDQVGSPTYTMDLIQVISMIIDNDAYGTYHVADEGCCSRYEFAKKIFDIIGKSIKVIPITTEELNRPAKRPKYSVLKNNMLELRFNYHTRNWQDALNEFLGEL